MSDLESSAQPPPTDAERFQVLARLIEDRLSDLYTARRTPSFTPAQSRELTVLESLRDDWINEAKQ